ncbi:TlyA family rRNA (cytidine-2'-O)-methyltransferase [Marinilactibacillus sp. 15R]|uniref:TlyA family RNA methyltransferase n=1 Tax=Marinilactibacillus sp. 15R TaxID=1911586 RepID=UPI00090C7178|nr:TlyA family RNA methyltransferase [Marinilactibacillus sp. 15R]API89954.1 TlyA family rRNA (cytidine-2'-O)-methyltransferase [Marinilactibacillus sp. 15R]
MKKQRADKLLIQQGWVEDSEKAKRVIMSGKVYTREEVQVLTAGEKLPLFTELYIKGKQLKYVSRGGLKLEKAIDLYELDLSGKIGLDIGSSTGGFTDAALQNGAKQIYAVDVGTNQLAWKLRNDERVIVMEQTNFRHSKLEDFIEGRPQFATIDVSFISLKLILPVLRPIIEAEGEVIALIKPQFEAFKEEVGKNGIITDSAVHKRVLGDILSFVYQHEYTLSGLTISPITGGKGNIEFLAYLKNIKSKTDLNTDVIEKVLNSEEYSLKKN